MSEDGEKHTRRETSEKSGKELDLGIARLLDHDSKEEGAAAAASSHSGEVSPAPDRLAKVAHPISDEFLLLAEKGAWRELVELCEERSLGLQIRPPQVEFWWIRAQFERGGIPSSMLQAPLCALARTVLKEGIHPASLMPMLGELLTSFAGDLAKKGEVRLADEVAALRGELIPTEQESVSAASATPTAEILPIVSTPSHPLKRPLSTRTTFVAGTVVGVILFFIGFGWLITSPSTSVRRGGGDFSSTTDRGGELLPPAADEIALVRPHLERASVLTNLDALLYDLDRAPSPQQTALPGALRESSSTTRAAPIPTKEQIDTLRPIEPADYGARTAPTPVSTQNPTDRLFQKDPRPLEVTKFPQTRIYEILVRTHVMAQPSFETITIAELSPGDRIEVLERFGDWLKLRSQRGRSGYILAQDARMVR